MPEEAALSVAGWGLAVARLSQLLGGEGVLGRDCGSSVDAIVVMAAEAAREAMSGVCGTHFSPAEVALGEIVPSKPSFLGAAAFCCTGAG